MGVHNSMNLSVEQYVIESEQCPTCRYCNDLEKCKLSINKNKGNTPYCENYKEGKL